MGTITIAIGVTGAAVLLVWCVGIARPRRVRDGERAYERDAFPLYLQHPRTPGTVGSIITAAYAAVPIAEAIRIRHPEPGHVEVDVVVPWTHVEPWGRSALGRELEDVMATVTPPGVTVDVGLTWR